MQKEEDGYNVARIRLQNVEEYFQNNQAESAAVKKISIQKLLNLKKMNKSSRKYFNIDFMLHLFQFNEL